MNSKDILDNATRRERNEWPHFLEGLAYGLIIGFGAALVIAYLIVK